MSIKSRFSLALGVVLLLHLFTAVMGHVGLARSQRDFAGYERVNADTIAVLSIDRTISELQRNVSKFMLSGHDAPAQRARELIERAEAELEIAIAASGQRPVREQLEHMAAQIGSYGENFEKVAVDRAARVRLVRDEMYPTRDEVLDRLGAIASASEGARASAKASREQMLLAETAALRYFDSPNSAIVRDAVGHLRRAQEAARGLPASTEGESVIALIESYEHAFLESVQATRGYLHLVNVVLAGQAAELLYDSSRIRSASLDQREMLSEAIQADARKFIVLNDTISLLTILAGVILASLMTRSVLRPILAITETLRSLARGDARAEIAGLERSDEIGAMANAAEVFRVKNIQTEQLLEESRRMATDLEQRNTEMTQFVYTVSHDLKTPLVTIQGYAELMQEYVEENNQDGLRDSSSRIIRASDRMYQTLNDLLELSRVGAVTAAHGRVGLDHVAHGVLTDMQHELQAQGVGVLVEDDLPEVQGDETQIRQVLQNLIQNAMKHGRPEHDTPEIRIGACVHEESVVLTVTDNGPGVKPEYAERVFGIFQRLSVDTPGTGVGLAIVKKIAEAHRGRAWVEEAPGGGARFCVSFPTGVRAGCAA